MTIRFKAALLIILIFAVVTSLTYLSTMFFTRSTLDEMTVQEMTFALEIADKYISTVTQGLEADALLVAERLLGADTVEEMQGMMGDIIRAYPDFISLIVFDRSGIVTSYGYTGDHDIFEYEQEYFTQTFMTKETVFSSKYVKNNREDLVMRVFVPMGDEYVLAAGIPALMFSEIVSDLILWKSGNLFIVGSNGNFIANYRHYLVSERRNFIEEGQTNPDLRSAGLFYENMIFSDEGVGRYFYEGAERICVYKRLTDRNTGWYIAVLVPMVESPRTNLQRELLFSAVAFLALGLVVSIILSGFAARPFQRLVDLSEELKKSNSAKSTFLATVSHEIRTPMNVILGVAEIELQNDFLEAGTRESIRRIHDSGEILLNIINDILDLSKIEAGKLELENYKYEVASLINDAATLNMVRIGSKPINFEIHVDENTPAIMVGDKLRIQQILNNLLSNAFKYTHRGSVKLIVLVCSDGVLEFTVIDTGDGMSEEQVEKLFDEYSRFNQQANRTQEGTGLGMSITLRLLNLMGGEIFVKSKPGEGTTVTVRMPQEIVGTAVLGKELVENIRNFRANVARQIERARIIVEPMPYGNVLIVDDVESNLYVAKGLMTPYGMKIETALSGYEAIEKIEKGNVYDIVFMDHMMPKMDGMEAVKIIRETGYSQPIVALTANAVVGQMDVFLSNGFDDFISKPIDMRHLNIALKKYVRDKQPPEVIEAARRQMGDSKEFVFNERMLSAVTPQLAEFFIRDAKNAARVLEMMIEKHGEFEEEDILIFTTSVHAMKNALKIVGEADLAITAARLERAGHNKDSFLISIESQTFLNDLYRVINKHTPPEESEHGEMDVDYSFLREKLEMIKKACEDYDKKTAKEAVIELRRVAWTPQVRDLLGAVAQHLLSGDLEEVSRSIDEISGIIIELEEEE